MRTFIPVVVLAFLLASVTVAAATPQAMDTSAPPYWAYPVNPPTDQPAKDDGTPKHVPGSSKALSQTQVLDSFNIADWHPEEHPQMPPSWSMAGSRPCGDVATAIYPMELGGPRMPVLQVFLPPTSRSKSPILETAPEKVPSRRWRLHRR